jgi:hypothetical protein
MNILSFDFDRLPWGLRVFAWLLILGAVYLLQRLYPSWGYFVEWATLISVPMLVLNLCFGIDGGDGTEKGWKFSAIFLTVLVFCYNPNTLYGCGTKLACSVVVILTLIYALFGHMLMENDVFPIIYDILYWLSIPICWLIVYLVPDVNILIKVPINDSVFYFPPEIFLYLIVFLRYGPLFSLFDGPVERKPSGVTSDDRCCRNCAYRALRRGVSGAEFDHCTYTHEDLGALDVYSKCSHYVRRKF